ncbi:MAG: SDR family oxidoreductase [Actinobacteria bacterium]|nr:SDR family oxidoreductase [Actinomycetota bacterium]
MEFDLTGKTAVITGAAHGIGKGIAEKFCQHGSQVIIIDINDDEAKKTVEEINKKYNGACEYLNCDVTKFEKVKNTCEEIINKYKKVDILVYNAGWGSRIALAQMDESVWHKAMDINLNGAFYFAKCLIEPMLENKKGNIILIGSSTTWNGGGGGVHYAASKAGLIGLVKGISYELLPKGIRANYITPAVIDTPLLRTRYPDNEETNKMLAAQIPLGRIGKPEDIANVALFLASDESEYICGHEIVADGGRILYQHPTGS